MNCGQVCICNERTLVHQDVFDDFVDRFIAHSRTLKVGMQIGARLMHRLPVAVLRRMFAVLLTGLALKMMFSYGFD